MSPAVRARGRGRSSTRPSNVCRRGRAGARRQHFILPSLFASEARGRAPKAVALQRRPLNELSPKAPSMFHDAGAVRFGRSNAPSRAVVKAGTLSSKPKTRPSESIIQGEGHRGI